MLKLYCHFANLCHAAPQALRRFSRGTRGVSAIEYALLLGTVAVGVFTVLTQFSDGIQATMTKMLANFSQAVS